MFNYIKETIINDIANVFAVDTTGFGVKRGGNYDFAKIVDSKVFKSLGKAGECGVIEIDPSKFTASGVDYRQIAIFIGASEKVSDFALANWAEFGKPIIVETSATDADGVVAALKLALPNDNPLFKVETSSSKVKITLAKSWMIPTECKVFEHKTATDELDELTTAGTVTTTPNVVEFGTAKWITENLRFPTYYNRRYDATYADEAPVAGTVYNQYAFDYKVSRPVPGGLSSVGQVVDSITTHVFYVPSSLSSAFEAFFGASITIEPVAIDGSSSN